MQLTPRYDGPPILTIVGLGDVALPLRRQRERLLGVLRSLTTAQWDAPSRCEKWSVKDVVSHLAGTDRFWAIGFSAAMRGEPTRFLSTFDPVSTPEQMVDGMRALSAAEVLAQYEANTAALLDLADTVTDWTVPAEAPPGHLALNVTALHALWDAWIHERDIVLPLGLVPVEDDEELTLTLHYAAALSPSFVAGKGTAHRGRLLVEAASPDVAFTVEVGERVAVRPGASGDGPRLRGRAADLIEGLSHRAPLPNDLPADDQWLLMGLAEVFDLV